MKRFTLTPSGRGHGFTWRFNADGSVTLIRRGRKAFRGRPHQAGAFLHGFHNGAGV